MKKLLIWGAGDQGTVALDCALAMKTYGAIDFLDFQEKGRREIPGHSIYREAEVRLAAFIRAYDEVLVASGNNELRAAKCARLAALGAPLATLVHPAAVVSPSARVARGCTVLATAVIQPNAAVGTGCIVNTGAIVEHDCAAGDFVNICPRVSLAGHVRIGERAFLGIGCTVVDQLEIGKGAVVGAGSVVIRNVPDRAVVAGVPAQIIRWA